ncbi:sec1 family domain-containing protein 1-like [Watersipora subatra]|uniref:sec1 family domain-containing protein 1-like n=1 Tax=Watersipora subatra TaxID=2589382 RepID=UPI00355BE610
MSTSVRQRQTAAIKRMLNFNQPLGKSSNAEPEWKVLVYDHCGQDIISPLFSVKELRDAGITLHQKLLSNRESIPDVPAIYFVLPTEENVKRLSKDLKDQLYQSYCFNFITAINRSLLEDLAQAAIAAQAVTQVHKVFDQYLNFVSLEEDMFTLRPADTEYSSYYEINRSDMKDTDMEKTVNTIVEGLFSYFVTLGSVPIIRCPRGNAAEMVAERLDKKLRENVRDPRNSLFNTLDSSQPLLVGLQRPLLVLLDRNMDLATPLHHTWTYQALAHDVLTLKLNNIEVEEGAQASTPGAGAIPKRKKKSFDLNSATDKLWQIHRGSPFPTVAEAIQENLDDYRSKEGEVTRLKNAMGLEGGDDDAAISLLSDNTAKLTSAMSSLPELLQKKRFLDMHTTIATALLDSIKARKLDLYFETEEKLMSRSNLETSLLEILNDPEAGTSEDKLRLIIIAMICDAAMSESEMDQYGEVLGNSGVDLDAIKYIRRWRTYTNLPTSSVHSSGGGTKTVSMFSKLMSQASSFAMEGVKNLVVKKHKLPATRIVDALMEQKSSQEVESYRYFDPKLMRHSESVPRNKAPATEAVVFLVGGGNYIEYQNLQDYAKGTKKLTYGCSQLLNAKEFVAQLTRLGQEIR